MCKVITVVNEMYCSLSAVLVECILNAWKSLSLSVILVERCEFEMQAMQLFQWRKTK